MSALFFRESLAFSERKTERDHVTKRKIIPETTEKFKSRILNFSVVSETSA